MQLGYLVLSNCVWYAVRGIWYDELAFAVQPFERYIQMDLIEYVRWHCSSENMQLPVEPAESNLHWHSALLRLNQLWLAGLMLICFVNVVCFHNPQRVAMSSFGGRIVAVWNNAGRLNEYSYGRSDWVFTIAPQAPRQMTLCVQTDSWNTRHS